ncbi:MAG: hypothetical protein ABI585_09830, partial [Betaproteobacteria bacterium]
MAALTRLGSGSTLGLVFDWTNLAPQGQARGFGTDSVFVTDGYAFRFTGGIERVSLEPAHEPGNALPDFPTRTSRSRERCRTAGRTRPASITPREALRNPRMRDASGGWDGEAPAAGRGRPH